MSTHYKNRQPSGCAGFMEDAALVPLVLVVLAAFVFLIVPFCVIGSLALWVKEGICRIASKIR
ncbi:hypothetical protein C1868_14190 [Eggerthella lenta]|jgi:hypothetical protein|uniref:hypothetical protein n=1 Tax=Eggerthellaceae TaxID=1643826 RepID=UPI000DF6865B|nr:MULTISPECIES: hypothetical protein [Eggerthellaceae]MCG4515371.1 hypothetical protein [Eggerthella lenta]RDB89855.1 hypothetical protein C1868_14190 [Eggerthella lenta]GKG89393.1 hypothetical protein CE91St32_04350 [Gordonibacter pamelaeae]DAL88936.1 MAG TPA: hypothetical protein [Caudoviricetes sp.]